MTDSSIDRLFAQAHREHPRLPRADAALRARVRRTVAEEPAALETLSFADLLLADGCAKGDPQALAEFERAVMPRVRQAIAKIDGSAQFLDEATQAVRERFFAGAEPRVRQYAGEGPLANWARVAAVRVALNLKRAAAGPATPPSDELVKPLPALSPELRALREQLREKFQIALKDALSTLSPAERNLLRLHLVDRLTLDQLGAMVGANKSTMSRRLQRIEVELVAKTREALQRRFKIKPRELESAMKVFTGNVPVDVKALLGE